MKKLNLGWSFSSEKPFKFDLKMKLTTLLLLVSLFKIQANTSSQDTKLTLNLNNVTLEEVFNKLESLTKFRFLYNHSEIDIKRKVSVKVHKEKIAKILKSLFKNTNISYIVQNNKIVFKKEIKSTTSTIKKEDKTITGIIKDSEGPLLGASIIVEGTSIGTQSDFDGNYTISVPETATTLVVSYIGYKTQKVLINNRTNIDILLEADADQLDGIVIIGYGSVAKKDLTGSVGIVDKIGERPVTSAAEGLQGSVAGITISATGGDPTATPAIKVRGIGTINNETPLWVVDGVPYYGGPLNPFDIASISILKDASSQAIYGVRASAGVILVTTKKGKNGDTKFRFNTFASIVEADKPKALSAADRIKYFNIAGFNTSDTENFDTVTRTNWVDEIFRIGIVKNYDLGVQGGNDKYTFASSIGLNQKEGVILNTKSDRFTFRLSSTFKATDKLEIGQRIYYTRTTGNSIFTGTTDENGQQSYNGIIAQAIKTNPSISVYDAAGNYSNLPVATINPVSTLNRLDIEDVNQDIFANVYFNYDVLDNLKLKSSFGINSKTRDFQQFHPKSPESSKTTKNQNSLDYKTAKQIDFSLETTLTYNKTFKDIHNLTLLAGQTVQRFERNTFSITGRDFSSELPNLRQIINATSWTKPASTYNANSLASFFGRAIYSYDDRYILTASVRGDGTSKLRPDISYDTWGTFPSVALAWRVSNEKFLSENKTISNLKLRSSWGIIGNINALDDFATDVKLETQNVILGSSDDNYENGLALNSRSVLPVWELTKSLNFGIDLSLFDSAWSLTGDYFIKTTEDMLLRLPLIPTEGISEFPFQNAGEVENKGFELSLSYQKNEGDFTYQLSGNISRIVNKLTALKEGTNILHFNNVASHTPLQSAIGQSLFSYYVLETAGIFQSDAEAAAYAPQSTTAVAGDLKFVDQNGDGEINDDDRVYKGSAFPDVTYAFNADLNYKNFDMRIFLQGVSGSSAYNGFKLTTVYPNQTSVGDEVNLSADAIDTWSPTNTGSTNFRLGGAGDNLEPSDFWIEDTSYLRLKNVTVGYTLPEIKYFNNIRVYASGENLFTITDYSGLDPEVGNRGLDGGQYPVATTFSLGLNLGF